MKNIVICCDGTCGEFGTKDKNTNVVRLFGLLRDNADQFVYYDPGVGTHNSRRTALGQRLRNGVASAFGNGLMTNVLQAYRYLMNYYEPGDKVFLFGYSRGAHTVRVLAGMLYKCGLLMKGSENLIPYMARVYKRNNNDQIAEDFKQHFSRDCHVHFIGVWDTVASMGWAWRRKYYKNTTLNPDVKYAYQALSIDEKRRHFQPSIWDQRSVPEAQTIEQVWFPGCHADIGGQDVCDRGISDTTLEWMLQRAGAAHLCLIPDWQEDLKPNSLGTIKQSWKWVWWLTLPKKRCISDPDQVHSSTRTRVADAASRYRPSNLPGERVDRQDVSEGTS